MSGICAVLRLDRAPASRGELAPVLAQLAARGPDGSAMIAEGQVALGHALLATTPEALTEQMPMAHPATGCVITADVRLDNRKDLLAALGLADERRVIGDGELILHSYLRWGTECPAHLLGDFAFAIWDPRHHRLFCARDQVGMRQAIYHFSPGRLFAIATDVEPLLRHPDVPRRINEGRIADFLEGLEAIDHTSTFFLDTQRLPPAHALVIENGAIRTWRYWQLTPPPLVRRSSDAAYIEAFLDVFTQAVRDRLRSPGPVGSMLSGGMDSGSVTAIAAQLLQREGAAPLKTFSAIVSDPDCLESRAIRAALGIPHIDPQLVNPGELGALADEVLRLTRESQEPFDGGMTMIRALYAAARRDGIKVMLDGVGGDTTLPTGDIIAYHLGKGRYLKGWREARAQERFWSIHAAGTDEIKAGRTFSTALKLTLVPDWLRAARRARREQAEALRMAQVSFVNPELADRVNMPERRRANAAHLLVERDCSPATQAQRMLHPYIVVGRERYDRVAGAVGIEPRDPFLDPRVLEFCLTLPPDQIRDDGWPKLILRRAMEGLLPDAVRWKTGRHHVGWLFIKRFADQSPQLDAQALKRLAAYARIDPETGAIPEICRIEEVTLSDDLRHLYSWLMTHANLAR